MHMSIWIEIRKERFLNDDDDDWALWIDVDVCDYPPDILKRLLAQEKHIITPNCVLEKNGKSFDLNNFLDVGIKKDGEYY